MSTVFIIGLNDAVYARDLVQLIENNNMAGPSTRVNRLDIIPSRRVRMAFVELHNCEQAACMVQLLETGLHTRYGFLKGGYSHRQNRGRK